MSQYDRNKDVPDQQKVMHKFEWMDAELRMAIREAEILAQHFQNIVAQMRDLSRHARPQFAVDYSALLKRRAG